MNTIFYVLEYSYKQNAYHIPALGETNLNTNGYLVVASAKEYYDLIKLIRLIRSIYDHPTYEEIDLVVSAFPNHQDVNL
jgi:hypothetical protein